MSRTIRLPLVVAGAVVVAALGFGAGFGVKALAGDDDDKSNLPASPQGSATIVASNTAGDGDDAISLGYGSAPGTAPMASQGGRAEMLGTDAAKSSILPYPGYGCTVPLPASLTANGISIGDDFAIRSPGSGLELRSFSARGEGPCEGQGESDVPTTIVVDTNWHSSDGIELSVSQRRSAEQTPNVLGRSFASVWVDGYTFNLSAYSTRVYFDGARPPVSDGGATDPAIAPAPEDDIRVQGVLRAALAAIAPDVAEECYAHEVKGDWADLAALGIGDPTGAIPNGFTLTDSSIIYYEPAAAGCDTPAPDSTGSLNVWANWNGGNGNSFLSINISAYPMKEVEAANFGPGQLNAYSANWQKGNLNFNIYGSTGGRDGLGVDTLRKIALALDPGFEQACFVHEVPVGSGDLAKFNIKEPSADGYKITDSRLVSWELSAGCAGNENAQEGFSFAWALDNGSVGISVNADKSTYRPGQPEGEPKGYINEGSIYWHRADGVWMNVSSYGRTGGPGASLVTLKAIARQLDPNINFDELEDGGKVVPLAGEAEPRRQ